MRTDTETTREVQSFCRICSGGCGVRLTIGADDRIVEARGDHDHPMTRGYACFKGLQVAESHYGPARLLHSMKRQEDGSFTPISSEAAFDEIAAKMRAIMDRHGPNAIGMFCGNGSMASAANFIMQRSFMTAIGSKQRFSTFTIDQSAKFVSFERLGGWAGGVPDLNESDVSMMFGTNPLISHGAMGVLCVDPVKRLKEARARGLKLIVIDPRRTETAAFADAFLQPLPGHDTAIAAAMLRLILSEGWEDKDFCARFVGQDRMDNLRAAVEPYTLEHAAALAGLNADDLRAATELFAKKSKKGIAITATGPNMATHSNLSQHLVDSINVICGRFPRAGDMITAVDVMAPAPLSEQVIPGPRSWTAFPPSRLRGVGMLYGERLSGTLADEILTPGDEQIRCLIVDGGNVANSLPNHAKAIKALKSLELLVVVDPYMTVTAEFADYVIAPRMQYERSDVPFSIAGMAFWPNAFSQYTPAIVPPPAGSDVVENWYVFWSLVKRLGGQIKYAEREDLDMENAPSSDDLLRIRFADAAIPFEDVQKYQGGNIFPLTATVQPAPEAQGRFDVMPEDVAQELVEYGVKAARAQPNYPFLLASRRMRDFFNSNGYYSRPVRARNPINALSLNPDDMQRLGLQDGDAVEISSDNGSVRATAAADASLRPGVVTLPHGWGGRPGDPDWRTNGVCVNPLIADDRDYETVNAMPRMSGVPVSLRRIETAA
ncbi:MAG: molybdopterin-dependent oxidoreductase [Caulobacterales bacterium]